MVLVYFRGFGNWFIDDNSGYSKYENKVEHREVDPDKPRMCRGDFFQPSDIVDGVFKLTDSDEQRYQVTGTINTDEIKKLRPCVHQGSAFTKLVENNRLPEDILGACYFEIERNRHVEFVLRKRPHLREQGELDCVLELLTQPSKRKSVKQHNEIEPRLETTYLRIIGALLECISGENQDINSHPSFKTEAKLIAYLDNKYGDYHGISKRTLEDKFPKAKKSLKDYSR